MEQGKNSITKTLLYFQIFDYPLKKKEIWQFLDKKISYKKFENLLKNIHRKDSFYFLNKKKNNIEKRKRRERISNSKINKTLKYIKKISFIPSLQFAGISGGLSMKNSEKNDDIDIFIISKKDFVWLTRLLLVLLFKFQGVYRSKGETNVKDKFCLNFIIGENKISFNKSERNLYLAHEIVQLLPIFQRDSTYYDFIEKNNWIGNFLPNFKEKISENLIPINKTTTNVDGLLLKLFNLLYIEKIVMFFQYIYMKPKITREKIESNMLAFHPKDYENIVLKKLHSRVAVDTRGH
ncbi:MAG: hypothetical protein A3B38_03335 [Candidatus Levybacteria bacterium RIFCSPLOWO2_01_FULL_36_13]|nr:MAG: hypothetical protein A2684_04280 [Candidatus Levybacteria bacterium RIFCSPHIGHO2_01_FULL_36_15b]OGH34714.1 MAG: hypothetical protein A3B38_03335 [Candidatus Levybacteria bacterium RIFCSPLOWO2_01_FULL_36_13]